jgi:Neuraminidase (sialidase)
VQLTTDEQGHWIAVWQTVVTTDQDLYYTRSSDNGVVWTPPAPLNTNAASDTDGDVSAQITTDKAGNWIAIWMSSDSLGGTIGMDLDILYARSTDNGASWTPPAALNSNAATDSGSDSRSQLATDNAGTWIAVWVTDDTLGNTLGTDGDILFSISTDQGVSWSPPAPLASNASTDSGSDREPKLVTDGAGTWLATWESDEDLQGLSSVDQDIFFSRSTDNGATWSAPAAVNTNAASDDQFDLSPEVTTDWNGNWIVAWESTNSLGGTIGIDFDILFARSTDDGLSWSAPAPLNTNAATDLGYDSRVTLTADRRGNLIATWQSDNTPDGTPGMDADILFALSTDNGESWSAPAAINTDAATDASYDSNQQLTTDGAGRWIAAWYSIDTNGGPFGSDGDILYATAQIDADLALDPGSLTFTEGSGFEVDVEQGGGATTRTLTVTNSGVGLLTINSLTLGGSHAGDFAIVAPPALPWKMAPATSSTLTIRFAPTQTQRTLGLAAQLTIGSNDPDTPSVVPIQGDAVPVELSAFTVD